LFLGATIVAELGNIQKSDRSTAKYTPEVIPATTYITATLQLWRDITPPPYLHDARSGSLVLRIQ